ncbi:MAG TPA: RsmB/NOP family class I SAM-dependent RNA methyltransferase [Kiloniellaceae bacterium]|nr:RsmB/NOP family class I SAM-dependent RNA methyltransferase [Kiloniellaceae bacterium]
MTPAARIAAVTELLEAAFQTPTPVERTVTAYLRRRRFIGAKDRRAIAQLFYNLLRGLSRLDWWLERCGQAVTPRARVLAHLALGEGMTAAAVAELFAAGGYGPAPLSASEATLLQALPPGGLTDAAQPVWVRAECPDWLWPAFEAAFAAAAEAEAAALIPPAPLDLRVNALKTTRDEAAAALAAADVESAPTTLSPWGLRIHGRPALPQMAAFAEGWFEPQDEASQLAALLSDARPGQRVLDLCAGAGGKALALAAAMGNQGQLLLHDRDEARLARAMPRLQRAGVTIAAALGADALAVATGSFDRVLIDAPCSGSGAWRRHPDARWRLQPDDLADRCGEQAALLAQGAALTAPGGRLIYATCSLLPQENERQVGMFLAARHDFAVLPVARLWAETLAAPCPVAGEDDCLTLTPAGQGCDGFFVAAMARQGAA